MNKKLFLIPLIILGYLFFILGIAWLIVDEPWMLDKVANEERIFWIMGINIWSFYHWVF